MVLMISLGTNSLRKKSTCTNVSRLFLAGFFLNEKVVIEFLKAFTIKNVWRKSEFEENPTQKLLEKNIKFSRKKSIFDGVQWCM